MTFRDRQRPLVTMHFDCLPAMKEPVLFLKSGSGSLMIKGLSQVRMRFYHSKLSGALEEPQKSEEVLFMTAMLTKRLLIAGGYNWHSRDSEIEPKRDILSA